MVASELPHELDDAGPCPLLRATGVSRLGHIHLRASSRLGGSRQKRRHRQSTLFEPKGQLRFRGYDGLELLSPALWEIAKGNRDEGRKRILSP